MEPFEILDFILENVYYSLIIKSLIIHGLLLLILLLIIKVFISIIRSLKFKNNHD